MANRKTRSQASGCGIGALSVEEAQRRQYVGRTLSNQKARGDARVLKVSHPSLPFIVPPGHNGPMAGEKPGCPFCTEVRERSFTRNDLAFAARDAYPVSEGHTLVIPHRHVADWFAATAEERQAILDLVDQVKNTLDDERHPDGYNVGFNAGEAAGQTVMHLHVHVIPRFAGDVDDPTGGVRLAVPEKGNYRRPGFVPSCRDRG